MAPIPRRFRGSLASLIGPRRKPQESLNSASSDGPGVPARTAVSTPKSVQDLSKPTEAPGKEGQKAP
jgi:hypothetical protein